MSKRYQIHERQNRIVAELRANPTVRIVKLAKAFDVSTETIRRDLDELSRRGKVNRTYGGAAMPPLAFEPGVNERLGEHVEGRVQVARVAASLVRSGDILMVDGGSTTIHFARYLAAEHSELTILTNSFGVAQVLAPNASLRIIVCPGDFQAREGIVYGAETLSFLERFFADKTFIGASGLTTEGPSEVNSSATWVKRRMLERAQRSILLADRSKFDKRNLETVCTLTELDDLVTDGATGTGTTKIAA